MRDRHIIKATLLRLGKLSSSATIAGEFAGITSQHHEPKSTSSPTGCDRISFLTHCDREDRTEYRLAANLMDMSHEEIGRLITVESHSFLH